MPRKQLLKKIDATGNTEDLGFTLTEEEIQKLANMVDCLPLTGGDITGTINYIFDGNPSYYRNILTINNYGLINTVHEDGNLTPTEVDFGNSLSNLVFMGRYNRPSYTNGEYETKDLALMDDIITKTSQLENDAGFITSVPAGVQLYETTGQNIDGAMTQKATTDELNKKVSKGTTLNDNYITQYSSLSGGLISTNILASDITTLSTKQTITGVKSFNANNHLIATCNSAYDSTTKVASLTGFTADHLVEGCEIYVKFTNGNTAGSTTSPVTLNVNNTGAKTMVISENATAGAYTQNLNVFGWWNDNDIIKFVYDATYNYWVAVENVTQHRLYSVANTTLYSTTGTSETAGMTQKAITDALSGKANTSDIPDITGKADKVSGATANNLASLDADGNLIDSGIASSQVTINTNNISQLSNKNWIINSNFHINQRGSTTYSSSGYTIDRWKNENSYGTLTKSSKYITFSASGGQAYLAQRIEDSASLNGKTVTFSVGLQDGTIYSVTDTIQTTQKAYCNISLSNIGAFYVYYYTTGYFAPTISVFNGNSVDVAWVKLEVGSIATPYVPTPYNEDLALCQRYYQKFSASRAIFISTGIASSTTTVYIPLTYQRMRAVTPTISHNAYDLYGNGTGYAITEISIYSVTNEGNGLLLSVKSSGLTKGYPYFFRLNENGYLTIDADI